MTIMELNAEMLRNLSIIVEDENLLRRAVKYLCKLAAEKETDPTLMTKEEFFARVDKAKAQYERGEFIEQLPEESVSDMLKRCGYAL